MKTMSKILAAAACAALTAGVASASGDLTGTTMNFIIDHTGPFGEPVGGTYQYGSTQDFFDTFNFFFTVSSPAGLGMKNSEIKVDFTNFAYGDFGGETATVSVSGIAKDVVDGTVRFLNSNLTVIGTGSASGNSFTGTYAVDSILAGDGVTLYIIFDVVPAPGALALLGVAGLVARRRRRA